MPSYFRLFIIVNVIFLSSCSTRLVYNYADWWLSWKVGDYVELTAQQSQQFDSMVERFKTWHRQSELPFYVSLLSQLNYIVEHKDVGLLEQYTLDVNNIWSRSAQKAVPEIILFLNKLSVSQKVTLIENIRIKQEEQHQEWLEGSKNGAQDKIDEGVERLEEWLGELSSQQRTSYIDMLEQQKSTLTFRIESRKHWLELFQKYLIAETEVDHINLYALLTDFKFSRSQQHQLLNEQNKQLRLTWLLEQLPMLSLNQQNHIKKSIIKYTEELQYLIDERQS